MGFETIVIGTDGSANATAALEVAADLASSDSVIHLVTAYKPASDREIAEVLARLPEEFHSSFDPIGPAGDTLTRAEQYLESRRIDHKSHLVSEHPAGAILDVAESVGADLIVVGSRGLGMTTRFIRGSTSARIANHAHCSFLVVQETST
jgi:nucleotide-binding universal stress UspA family protein